MSIVNTLAESPLVSTLVLGGISWAIAKLWGSKKSSTLARVTSAIATSAALMEQAILTGRAGDTPEAAIVTFKGFVAVQLSKVGVYEPQRASWEWLTDRAIAVAVTAWVHAHPSPKGLALPIIAKGLSAVSAAR